MKRRSVLPLLLSVACLGCDGDTYGFTSGVPINRFDQIQAFLTCIECEEGERDAIRTLGRGAVGLLSETLRGLPPGREENLRRRLVLQMETIHAAGIDTAGLVEFHLANFRSLVQGRSAIGLADLGEWDSLRMALDSSEVWGYRIDVLEEIQGLLFADTMSVPIPVASDGVIRGLAEDTVTGTSVAGMSVFLRRCGTAPPVRIGGSDGGCLSYLGPASGSPTGGTGEFEFAGLEEGVYELSGDPSTVAPPGSYANVDPVSALFLVVDQADTVSIQMVVGNLNVVRGRVRGTEGTPADGSEVLVTPHPANSVITFADTLLPVSPEGEFILQNLPEGQFLFRALDGPASDWVCTNPAVTVDVRGPESEQRVELECGWVTSLSGAVRGPDGMGLAGVTLTLQPLGIGGAQASVTDGVGNYLFSNVSGEEYIVALAGYPPDAVVVSGNGELSGTSAPFLAPPGGVTGGTIEWDFDRSEVVGGGPTDFLYLRKTSGFRGRVVEVGDPNQPVEGVRMLLRRCDDSFGTGSSPDPILAPCHSYDTGFPDSEDTRVTDATGEFEFIPLLQAVYEVRIDPSVPGVVDRTGPVIFRISAPGPVVEFMSNTDATLNFQGG